MIVVIAKTSEVVANAKTVTAAIARAEIVTIVITEMIAIGADVKNAQDIETAATAVVQETHQGIVLGEETPPETKKTGIIAVADQ